MANQSETNKAAAIRETLDKGITSAAEAMEHLKNHYGLEVSRSHFSSAKSRYGEKSSTKPATPPAAKRGRPTGVTKAAEPVKAEATESGKKFASVVKRGRPPGSANKTPATQPANSEAKANSVMISDLTAVKALVQRLGATEVKAIADLFD